MSDPDAQKNSIRACILADTLATHHMSCTNAFLVSNPTNAKSHAHSPELCETISKKQLVAWIVHTVLPMLIPLCMSGHGVGYTCMAAHFSLTCL